MIDPLIKNKNHEYLEQILRLAPTFASPARNTKSLADKFIYRFNHSPDLGAIYAVVLFGPQLAFQIMAVSQEIAERLDNHAVASGEPIPTEGVFHCTLKRRC